MTLTHLFSRVSLAAIVAGALVATAPAHALTAKGCRAAFNQAKSAGTLDGQKYKAFKAAKCGASATPEETGAASTKAEPAKTAETKPAPTTTPASTPAVSTPASAPAAAPKATVAASGNVVFPNAVSAQYAKLSAGRARQKTCVAQYNANKANGGNGNLKWIQRGGGYWSQCNARLKGAQ